MQIRTALLAIAATSALSTAAFAATGTALNGSHSINHPSAREQMSDRCSTLESQYDGVIESRQGMAKVNLAEGLHARGVDQCESNAQDLGVLSLERSLHDLGVKPAA